MIEKKIHRILVLGIISGFFILSLGMFIAWLHPAIDVEASIYASTPCIFWISIFYGYAISILIFIFTQFLEQKIKYLKKLGMLLLIFTSLSVVSLSIIRGYQPWYLISDTGSHLGNLQSLMFTGFTSSLYPGGYYETVSLSLLTDISLFSLINYNSLIFLAIFVSGIYLLVQELFKTQNLSYIIVLIACLLPFGCSYYTTGVFSFAYYLPYLNAFMLCPLFMFCVLKSVKSNPSNSLYLLISCIFGIVIILSHPLIFVIILFFPLSLLLIALLEKHSKVNSSHNIKNIIILLLISGIIFVFWAWYANILQGNVMAIYDIVMGNNLGSDRLVSLTNGKNTLTSGNFSLFEILEIGIRYLVLFSIMFLLFIIAIPILYLDFKKSKRYVNGIIYYIVALPVLFITLIPYMGSFSFQSGRVVLFISLFSIFSTGIIIHSLLRVGSQARSALKKGVSYVLVVAILLFILVFSVFSYYPSYNTLESSTQITTGTLEGMDFYLTNSNYDYYKIGDNINLLRFLNILYTTNYLRIDSQDMYISSNNYLPLPPYHYNYESSSYIGSSYVSETYLITRDALKKYYDHVSPDYFKFVTSQDYQHLLFDTSVQRIYDGSDIDISIILGYGSENYGENKS